MKPRSVYKKILFFICLCPALLSAQEYLYKEFGLNEGLPSSQVYSTYQDRNGVMWFATDRGVASYNGYEIRQYGINDGLTSFVILDFYPQPDGRVYCSTFDNKLFYFEQDFNGFKPYPHNAVLLGLLEHNHTIKNMYFDQNGSLHVGSITRKGKIVIDKNGKILEEKKGQKRLDRDTRAVYEDHGGQPFYYLGDGTAAAGTASGTLECEGCESGKIQLIRLPESRRMVLNNDFYLTVFSGNGQKIRSLKSKYRPINIKPLSSTTFFVGYLFGGGCVMDIEGNVLQKFLESQSVTRFFIDREGGYWFTTLYSGVFYVKEPAIRVFKQKGADVPIHALTKNKQGDLFVSYDTGEILKVAPGFRTSTYFKSGILSKSFLEYDAAGKEIRYAGNELRIDGKKNHDGELPTYILKFSEPSQKGILSSEVSRIHIISSQQGKPDAFVKTPFRTHDACYWKDDIYFAGPAGVFVYGPDHKFKSLAQFHPFFANRVDDIDYNGQRNELYFASLGQGLVIYDKNTETVRAITKTDGLLSNIVNEIYIEGKNEIWACTNSGLNRIVFREDGTLAITGLKSADGLLNDGISDIEIIKDTVWIASKKGLAYAPKALFNTQKSAFDYLVRIKSVLVNDKRVSLAALRDLPHDRNRVEFSFIGISLKSQGNLLYKYTLEGLDTKWYYTRNRKIAYPSLPYGSYTLKLSVYDTAGSAGRKQLEIPITIHPPFWKTSWFLLLLALLLTGLTYLFFRFRILSFNRDITRELLRLLVKKIKRRDMYFIFRENGRQVRIKTDTIFYVRSSGNYIEVVTSKKNYVVRCKIGDFIAITPDPLEYIRIHRSYIVRIDKVESKSRAEVIINGEVLPVSQSYEAQLTKLIF